MCGFHYRLPSSGNCARVEMKQWRCWVGKMRMCGSVCHVQVSSLFFFSSRQKLHSVSWQNTKLEKYDWWNDEVVGSNNIDWCSYCTWVCFFYLFVLVPECTCSLTRQSLFYQDHSVSCNYKTVQLITWPATVEDWITGVFAIVLFSIESLVLKFHCVSVEVPLHSCAQVKCKTKAEHMVHKFQFDATGVNWNLLKWQLMRSWCSTWRYTTFTLDATRPLWIDLTF